MKLTTLALAAFALCAVHVPLCYAQGAAPDDAAQLKQKLAEQQKQIDALKQAIEEQQKMLDLLASKPAPQPAAQPAAQPAQPAAQQAAASPNDTKATPNAPGFQHVGEEVASTTGKLPYTADPAQKSPTPVPDGQAAPLSFDIGVAKFTPLGFVDVMNVIRTTDVGGGLGTGFASIPLNNAVAGHLSESRFSLQNSRLGLRIDSNVLGMNVLGYLETDFLGNAPTNIVVNSNPNTLRMRLFFVDLKKSKWEILGGQTWSLMTPNRSGISPLPGEIFYSQDVDTNYQLGLTWTRAAEFRVGVHFNDNVAWAIAAENPEQSIGSAEALPATAALATAVGTEFDSGTQTSSVPNVMPDIISKLAFFSKSKGLDNNDKLHFEVTGLYRTFASYNPVTNMKYYKAGVGGEMNFNLELVPGFRFIANTFASDGGGRYTGGVAPDLIVRADGSIAPIHTYSTVDGFEYLIKPKSNSGKETMLYTYYSAEYLGRDVALDTTGQIGYGIFTNAASLNANRDIQEYTVGVHQTFWKDKTWGDLRLMTQYSYLTRDPWFVPATNTQRNAHTNLIYLDLRYDIP